MSLARRTISSISWNVAANVATIGVLFVRSILLARLLPVPVFGVYAFAGSLIGLTVMLPNFGMGGAFLHRAPETLDEKQSASVHFTLKTLFTAAWVIVLMSGALLFAEGDTRTALVMLTLTSGAIELTQTPRLVLVRRVQHRRLAMIQFLNAILTTLVAVGLAWRGVTLWALLATDLVTLTLEVSALYLWHPVWRPYFTWSPPHIRYFLRFGSRSCLASVLMKALDRVDDLWTGIFLGKTALGYYSRAYTFATYPRRVLAAPMNDVTRGTYAELKGDRQRLSRAFFRVNAILLRSGFFMGGLIYLVAPEFIRLFLGEKWLPMLAAFRLMLVFELLDPCKITISYVFEAVGQPERVVQARSVQLAVMVAGLFLLGPPFGITGVALAVNIMLVVGIVLLLWMARTHVDFSIRKLFLAPTIALTAALALGFGTTRLPGFTDSDWLAGLLKALVFSSIYVLVWLVLERSEAIEMMRMLRRGQLGWTGKISQPGNLGGARAARVAPSQNSQDGAI